VSQLYKTEVDYAVELMRSEMLTNPGPVAPRLMAFPPEWTGIAKPFSTALDPDLMGHWQAKNTIGSLIVKILFQAHARVTVFFSDALFGAPPPGKTFADMPCNLWEWPKSLTHEALLVNVNAIGMKGYGLSYGYTRDGKDRRVFNATTPDVELDTGRFCFDLTNATEESATLDALHRNRDGRLEATDVCQQCEGHPFELCPTGRELLTAVGEAHGGDYPADRTPPDVMNLLETAIRAIAKRNGLTVNEESIRRARAFCDEIVEVDPETGKEADGGQRRPERFDV
jgi:hypothetical protein